MSWDTSALARLFWADEMFLVFSRSIHANLFLLAGLALFLGAAALQRTLKLALALHTVPYAVAKVDEET